MKKRIVLVLLAFVFALSFLTGCSDFWSSITGGNKDGGTAGQTIVARSERNIVTPASEIASPGYDLQSSFYNFDTQTSYYVYYLGKVERIPLSPNLDPFAFNGTIGGTVPFVVQDTSMTATEISQQLSTSASQTFSFGYDYSFNFGIDAMINTGINISANVSIQKSTSLTVSNLVTHSSSTSQTLNYVFTKDNPKGYYRYILFADADYFGVIKVDENSGEASTFIHQRVYARYKEFDYSPTTTFSSNSSGVLTFDTSKIDINALPIPSKCVGESHNSINPDGSKPIIELTAPSYTYYGENDAHITIDASHRYGKDDIEDFIDLTRFAPFLNSNYKLKFEVWINMKEKEDGYQEVYLMDWNGNLIAENGAHDSGDGLQGTIEWRQLATWEISGEKFGTYDLYFEYDAHGKNSDDWVRYGMETKVTVIKK